MFDIGFSELLLIGVVALIVVGPKDLPAMFRTVGKYVGKAKAMARDFQRSMEDAADASGFKDIQDDLKGVTKGLEDINKFANPGFAAGSAAKDQFKKILDAKESGEPMVEDADDSVAGVQEEPAQKIVEIVEDAPAKAAKPKAAKPKTAKPATKPKAAKPAAKPKAAKPKTAKPAAKPKTAKAAKPKAVSRAKKPAAKPKAATDKTPADKT